MAKVKVKMQRRGSRDILRSNAIENYLRKRVEYVAGMAGDGFIPHTFVGFTRAFGSVSATTADAMIAESETHILTRALLGSGAAPSRVKYTSKSGRVSYVTQAQYNNYTRNK